MPFCLDGEGDLSILADLSSERPNFTANAVYGCPIEESTALSARADAGTLLSERNLCGSGNRTVLPRLCEATVEDSKSCYEFYLSMV